MNENEILDKHCFELGS